MITDGIPKSASTWMYPAILALLALPCTLAYLKTGGLKLKGALAQQLVLAYVGIFTVVTPYIMQVQSGTFHPLMIIFVAGTLIVLDFLSIYEDKSRFADNAQPICLLDKIVGHCRNNALWTGLASHLIDTLVLWAAVNTILPKDPVARNSWKVACVAIAVLGSWYVHNLTKAGGPSDLRNMDDNEKCAKNRIMKDNERGMLNLLITFIAIVAGWQSIMADTFAVNGPRDYGVFTAWVQYFVDFCRVITQGDAGIPSKVLSVVKAVAPAMVGVFADYINTSFQFDSESSAALGLPACFD